MRNDMKGRKLRWEGELEEKWTMEKDIRDERQHGRLE